ncbi:hypothetical protein LAWI1_G005082 [Lachnellula willkommii]|uniref:BTB domain-containing protein n=1 Tax=Lachnellula willkommii TaxID=215461 RepID=A0A559MAN1_9HELO|nr:hypothetical protein LAWI1_G005082 [Lachnellula willkommii]
MKFLHLESSQLHHLRNSHTLPTFSPPNSTSFASSRTIIKLSTLLNIPILNSTGTRRAMAGAINPFDFEGGDLTIVVMYEGKRVTGKVSTSAMMLASPVWKKFIFPPWNPLPATHEEGETTGGSQNAQEPGGVDVAAETVGLDDADQETLSSRAAKKQRTSQASKSKELDFTEDNADTFLILLRIAHLQFSKLPVDGMSLDLLFQLATVSDKYDCIQLVKPWIPLWTVEPEIEMENLEKLLFVALVFRLEDEMWNKVLIRAVERLSIDSEFGAHEFSGDSGELSRTIALDQLPPGLLGEFRVANQRSYVKVTNRWFVTCIERLLAKRQELLGKIFDAAYEELDYIFDTGCEHGDFACRATRYGFLCVKLKDYGVSPPPRKTSTLYKSLRDVKEDLTELQRRHTDDNDQHQYCGGYQGGSVPDESLWAEISRMIDDFTFDFDSLPTE